VVRIGGMAAAVVGMGGTGLSLRSMGIFWP
jgi:hypothetical protein